MHWKFINGLFEGYWNEELVFECSLGVRRRGIRGWWGHKEFHEFPSQAHNRVPKI